MSYHKFKAGDWVTPNPDRRPNGATDGRLTMGKAYCIIRVTPDPAINKYCRVMCDNGTDHAWLEICWVPYFDKAYETLDDIHACQEAYSALTKDKPRA